MVGRPHPHEVVEVAHARKLVAAQRANRPPSLAEPLLGEAPAALDRLLQFGPHTLTLGQEPRTLQLEREPGQAVRKDVVQFAGDARPLGERRGLRISRVRCAQLLSGRLRALALVLGAAEQPRHQQQERGEQDRGQDARHRVRRRGRDHDRQRGRGDCRQRDRDAQRQTRTGDPCNQGQRQLAAAGGLHTGEDRPGGGEDDEQRDRPGDPRFAAHRPHDDRREARDQRQERERHGQAGAGQARRRVGLAATAQARSPAARCPGHAEHDARERAGARRARGDLDADRRRLGRHACADLTPRRGPSARPAGCRR